MKKPKQKAKDLINMFGGSTVFALAAVEEILNALPMYTGNINPTWKFYDEVKEEILNRQSNKKESQLTIAYHDRQ